MDFVSRVNLKTDAEDRANLIAYCLAQPNDQYLAIGWSFVYKDSPEISTYDSYYQSVALWSQQKRSRLNTVHNLFKETKPDDLFWTRDLSGYYWICRAKDAAKVHCDFDLDIGAVIPVQAYLVGLEVPGQIKAAFNRANSGTAQRIYDKNIVEYSKLMFNVLSKTERYEIDMVQNGDLINNLPDFELEELVIAYIQIKYNYYVLSNSIANKSTTVSIECEFRSRCIEDTSKAIVQVKGGNRTLVADDYTEYLDKGFRVFLYAKDYENDNRLNNVICIGRDELMDFYHKYKKILPDAITQWENLLQNNKA